MVWGVLNDGRWFPTDVFCPYDGERLVVQKIVNHFLGGGLGHGYHRVQLVGLYGGVVEIYSLRALDDVACSRDIPRGAVLFLFQVGIFLPDFYGCVLSFDSIDEKRDIYFLRHLFEDGSFF